MSTGNLLPGIFIIGASLKYLENFYAYKVADEIITFKSGLSRHKSLIRVRIISV
jgi:hypothetical protein